METQRGQAAAQGPTLRDRGPTDDTGAQSRWGFQGTVGGRAVDGCSGAPQLEGTNARRGPNLSALPAPIPPPCRSPSQARWPAQPQEVEFIPRGPQTQTV